MFASKNPLVHPSPSTKCEHSGFFPGDGTFALSRLDGNPNFCLSRVADFEETEELSNDSAHALQTTREVAVRIAKWDISSR